MSRALVLALLAMALIACSNNEPIMVEVVYERSGSYVPRDVKRLALAAPTVARGTTGGENVAGALIDQLSRRLSERYDLIGPTALSRASQADAKLADQGDVAVARAAGADAAIVGRLRKLVVDQRKVERLVTAADRKGQPVRKQVPDVRLEIQLSIVLELVSTRDGALLARLYYDRAYRQQHREGEEENLLLLAHVPRTRLADRLRANPKSVFPTKDEILAALIEQCAVEFQRELVPFTRSFQVALMVDEENETNVAGIQLMRQLFPGKAAELFMQSTESAARPDVPWYNLGVAYEQMGRYMEAEAAYRSAMTIKQHPEYQRALDRVAKYGR